MYNLPKFRLTKPRLKAAHILPSSITYTILFSFKFVSTKLWVNFHDKHPSVHSFSSSDCPRLETIFILTAKHVLFSLWSLYEFLFPPALLIYCKCTSQTATVSLNVTPVPLTAPSFNGESILAVPLSWPLHHLLLAEWIARCTSTKYVMKKSDISFA